MIIKGKIWRFGDDIDTDAIIPARCLHTSDMAELARHVMEDADPSFPGKVKAGDIIVAGKNFGCGSSREHAPLALKGAGIACIIADSFARIFYRNAINIGLPILESPQAARALEKKQEVEVNLQEGTIKDLKSGRVFQAAPFPPSMQDIIKAGGLVNYVRKRVKQG
ncbi:MAG: 3-isopropylmalate dehydratase small subunit [Firmicutes bacterium]|nr:3-isopropylmalate dehydratase small subunit [Bacillota bacterium]